MPKPMIAFHGNRRAGDAYTAESRVVASFAASVLGRIEKPAQSQSRTARTISRRDEDLADAPRRERNGVTPLSPNADGRRRQISDGGRSRPRTAPRMTGIDREAALRFVAHAADRNTGHAGGDSEHA